MPEQDIISESYREFRSPVKIREDTFYERLARRAGSFLKIDTKNKRLEGAIEFAHLNIKPRDVASLTALTAILSFVPVIIYIIAAFAGMALDILFVTSISLAGIAAAYYFYTAPRRLKKRYEMTVGADMISAILYMVIYMRNTPSLEGAVEFAARNTTAGMQVELAKLLWDVRVGNYLSVEDALLDYSEKWKGNREFGEAVGLIINSTRQSGARFHSLLDEAVRIVLSGNKETSQNYISNLRMPLMAVNAMGLILPVMGLVLFPVISIFLSVGPVPLLVMYDILLPIMLFFLMASILEKRPVTFSKIDVSRHPRLPPPGKFYMGKRLVSAAAVAFLVGIILAALALFLYSAGLACTEQAGKIVCQESETAGFVEAGGTSVLSFSVLSALLFTLAITLAPGTYFLLISRGRSKLREDIRSIEDEFKEALFQLGTRIRSGVPIEKAMIESIQRMEGLKIRELFLRAAQNMQKFSMTFEQAFFDKEQGAIRFYPSTLIESVMKAITEAAKKGPANAGTAMLSISRYLKDLHNTQEYVQRSMHGVTNSIKFQAYVLTPLISGVIATMAIVIIRILGQLQLQQSAISGFASLPVGGSFAFGELVITPFQFIVVVSIFVAQSLFLYGYLLSGVEVGEDPIRRSEILSGMFFVSPIVYAAISVISLLIFGPLTQFNV
ncbi:MAG: hypothetical protein HYW25_00950 [Candidatus Aenigmarchaeota archaeon]|nr:hypothetical protein [Candidatus Aenigmarchaeota archaeon]